MFSWFCSCGEGGASVTPQWDDALRQGELHSCRIGRLRHHHVVSVKPARQSEA